MTRRLLFALTLCVAMMLLLVAGSGLWLRGWWAGWLQDQGIGQLEWSGLSVEFAGLRPRVLRLGSLTVEQQSGARRLRLEGTGLEAGIRWQGWQPALQRLGAEDLQLDVWSAPAPDALGELPEHAESYVTGPLDQPPLWLPEQVRIDGFYLRLPCRLGRCGLSGSLALSRAPELLPLHLTLTLDDPQQPVVFEADVQGQWPHQVRAEATLSATRAPFMTLATNWQPQPQTGDRRVRWQGRLDAPELPDADWLLARLADWFEVPENPLADQPRAGALSLYWQLDWPADEAAVPQPRLLLHPQLRGDAGVQARLPQPWPLPGLGTVQGDLALELRAEGRWLARTAQGQLRLTGLGNWVEALPQPLRPDAINLSLTPAGLPPGPSAHPGLLPLRLSLITEGAHPLALESHLAIATRAPWMVQLGATRLRGRLPAWHFGDWRLQGLRADLVATGEVTMERLQLTLGQGSTLDVDHLDPAAGGALDTFWLDGLRWRPEGLGLVVDYDLEEGRQRLAHLTAEGPLRLTARSVRHPALKTQSWQLQGRGLVNLQQVRLNGQLTPAAGGPLTLSLDAPFDGPLTLEVGGRWQGKAGSDALAGTLTDWPPLLGFDQGAMTAELVLRQPPGGGAMTLSGALGFDQLSGLYDRMAWSGLSGRVPFTLEGDQLLAQTTGLTLAQLNPGIPAGPVVLSGRYQAATAAPAAGELVLGQAQARMLGGELVVEPQSWSLARRPLIIPVSIRALELGRLLTAYPMEGLSGTGMLNGHLPVHITSAGVAVVGGKVTAEAPGGTLVFPADRLRAIAQNNPALNLVAQAMENFRYSVLNSTIDYDEDGTLQLGLNLEGANPAVQQGQAVRLNLNIEENIPDLMTSLQLSGKVNEAVTERVRQLLQERGRTAP